MDVIDISSPVTVSACACGCVPSLVLCIALTSPSFLLSLWKQNASTNRRAEVRSFVLFACFASVPCFLTSSFVKPEPRPNDTCLSPEPGPRNLHFGSALDGIDLPADPVDLTKDPVDLTMEAVDLAMDAVGKSEQVHYFPSCFF